MNDSIYARGLTAEEISANFHRVWVGGLWEEIGALQYEFLRSRGLKPGMKLLDIGCGAFRGGIHFMRYLHPGNYYGIDRNESLLRAGIDIEVPLAGIAERFVSSNVIPNARFEFQKLKAMFDIALAQSVFSHIGRDQVRLCLSRLAPTMRPGSVFYASFFERPETHNSKFPVRHSKAGVVSHAATDPYNYSLSDIEAIIRDLPWLLEYIGDWGHPRDQMMLAFHRTG